MILVLFLCFFSLGGAPLHQKCLTATDTEDGRVKYVDESEGISFVLDKGWEVECGCEDFAYYGRCISLRPGDYLAQLKEGICDNSKWLITVKVYKGKYDKWLDEGPFEHEGVRYRYAGGRMGDGDMAIAIKGPGWKGILGCGVNGCYGKNQGGYLGLGTDVCTALISDGERTAIINFDSTDMNYSDIYQTFLGNFRFLS